jgi:hypothetical protein
MTTWCAVGGFAITAIALTASTIVRRPDIRGGKPGCARSGQVRLTAGQPGESQDSRRIRIRPGLWRQCPRSQRQPCPGPGPPATKLAMRSSIWARPVSNSCSH